MTFKKAGEKISNVIFGHDPVSSLAGYILSGVIAVQPFLADEFISTKRLVWIGICAILVAILGRVMNRKKPSIRRKVTPTDEPIDS